MKSFLGRFILIIFTLSFCSYQSTKAINGTVDVTFLDFALKKIGSCALKSGEIIVNGCLTGADHYLYKIIRTAVVMAGATLGNGVVEGMIKGCYGMAKDPYLETIEAIHSKILEKKRDAALLQNENEDKQILLAQENSKLSLTALKIQKKFPKEFEEHIKQAQEEFERQNNQPLSTMLKKGRRF